MSTWDYYYIHTVKDPTKMVNKNCVFYTDPDSLIYVPGSEFGMGARYDYLCKIDAIADWIGCAWVVNRKQLVDICRDNVLAFNSFDFENLPEGYYAIVCWDYS